MSLQQTQPQVQGQLMSTTAPGKLFESRLELAQHYKSDWHKYNLKRREAGLPLLRSEDFEARLEAALSLRREREQKDERSGKDHLKQGKKIKNKKVKKQNDKKAENGNEETETTKDSERNVVMDDNATDQPSEEEEEEEEIPEVDPRQCLFDKHKSPTVEANVERMLRKYGFFIPDQEYLIDLEGFVGYCQEKVKLGHYCLYCQRLFTTWYGCQKHMVSTRHTKLQYARGVDLDEFDPFYDFSEANNAFFGAKKNIKTVNIDDDDVIMEKDDDNSGDWEDVTDDEEMDEADNDDDDDEGLYDGYEEEIAKYGFNVTPLGELVFPDGKIVGHRGLSRYYKQRPQASNNPDRTSIVAARRAAGEVLFQGRVYNRNNNEESTHETSLALARAGIAPGSATGRSGNGVLVASGAGGFTALSLYRYKAVVKKARREEFQGKRLQDRTRVNMNKMDKKANRLHNNVSVAWAKR